MTIRDDELLSYVVERDVDLVFVQLLQTSADFRDWFVDRLEFDRPVTEFLGVRHSVITRTGESDIEIGVKTPNGEKHIVLVENKIDASLQDRQVERYFERGERYVGNDEWDAFTVCLVAPTTYVGETERQAFDAIVSYEDVMDVIEETDHDGREFFLAALRQSLTKSIPADNTDVTAAIRQRFRSSADEYPHVNLYQVSNTQVRLESTHDDHPNAVLYNAYVPGPHDGDKTIVRINLTGRGDVSEEETEAIRSIFVDELKTPVGFEEQNRPMDVVRKDVLRADFESRADYVDAVIENLLELVDFYHPKLVQVR